MISVHGLLRGSDPELGRDADTGGQITYVLDLARELGKHSEIARVDVLTRLIEDPEVSPDYAVPEEMVAPNVFIRRLPFGPKRYLRKELLWNHLDQLTDRCLHDIRKQGWVPDVIHSHYADAGYVGRQLSQLLGVPLIHTGHSLGRCKRQSLLESGRKAKAIDNQFHFPRRIEEEERILAHADLIVASTTQERDTQYALYEKFDPRRCFVLPPGVDLERFAPPTSLLSLRLSGAKQMVDRFLHNPAKPMILTLCRPAPRKNLLTLLEAYGEDKDLQEKANLVILAGQREDLRTLDPAQADVIRDLFVAVDRYDLYGKVAMPKRHTQDDVKDLYRLAARRRGVFINPALTEPFGLTLLEAAIAGLPVVATEDGGPRDIVANCRNGLLVNPLDKQAIAAALHTAIENHSQWRSWSRAGKRNVERHYGWPAHAAKYIKNVNRLLHKARKGRRRSLAAAIGQESLPLPLSQWALISDIDNTLTGDSASLATLRAWRKHHARTVAFGVATGRTIDSALKILRQWRVRPPDIFITAVGTEIYYGRNLVPDTGWTNHIQHYWRRDGLAETLRDVPGLTPQGESEQRKFKLSYYVDPARMPPISEMEDRIRAAGFRANLIYSHNKYLDVLPIRASKGHAVRYLAYKFGLPLERFLVAGDSGNDVEMMVGDTLGVIVSNHSPELTSLRGHHRVYFASTPHAEGIMEGIRHYHFGETPEQPAGQAPVRLVSSNGRTEDGKTNPSGNGFLAAGNARGITAFLAKA